MADEKPILLIAEDDSMVGATLKRVLGSTYDIRLFESGTAALAELQKIGRPVVLMTDYGLEQEPEGVSLNGLEVIKRARAMQENIPVILYTGYASDETRQQANKFDVPVLLKGSDRQDILDAVAAAQRKLEGGKSPIEHATRRPQSGQRGFFD